MVPSSIPIGSDRKAMYVATGLLVIAVAAFLFCAYQAFAPFFGR